jgi:hypothetical protein
VNVVLLEQGTSVYTNNFPETPDPSKEPIFQQPQSTTKKSGYELRCDEVRFGMEVAIEKYGGDVVLARIVGNLGQGLIGYREEIFTPQGVFLSDELQRLDTLQDRITESTRSVLPGLEQYEETTYRTDIPCVIPESLVAVDYVTPPQTETLL